ncbi:MAG: hypothetical protein ACPHY8_03725 [Patescibacteria group bacterium]
MVLLILVIYQLFLEIVTLQNFLKKSPENKTPKPKPQKKKNVKVEDLFDMGTGGSD